MTSDPTAAIEAALRDSLDDWWQTPPRLDVAAARVAAVLTAVPAAGGVVSAAPDRADLRDRIRRAVCEAEGFAWDTDMLEPDEYGEVADAVLAVLPPPAEAHRLALSEALGLGTGAPWDAIHDRATELGLPPLDRDPVAQRLGLLPPPADRAAVCICGHTEQQHFEDVCITEVTGCQCGDYLPPNAAREVIARYQEAVKRVEAERDAYGEQLDEAAETIAARTVEINRLTAELRRVAAETQQQECAAPEALDLTDGPVHCPLCPTPVTLHTPNGARAHFTNVHPEQRLVGPGPWPLLATDGAEAQQQDGTETQPPHHRWMVETRDAVADQWAPGMRFTDRSEAVARYRTVSELYPEWRDGTPVERRLVRETTTFTVEDVDTPAVSGPRAADDKQDGAQRVVQCSRAILSRPHPAHDWEPQPGMDPVHCPGHTFTEAPR